MKLILAQNCSKGFVAVDVVSYSMYESDRGKLKMPLNFKMYIYQSSVHLMLKLPFHRPVKIYWMLFQGP